MKKLHLVWNTGLSECVGFRDERDAAYTATGERHHLEFPAATPTIGDAFRETYADDLAPLPQSSVEIEDDAA